MISFYRECLSRTTASCTCLRPIPNGSVRMIGVLQPDTTMRSSSLYASFVCVSGSRPSLFVPMPLCRMYTFAYCFAIICLVMCGSLKTQSCLLTVFVFMTSQCVCSHICQSLSGVLQISRRFDANFLLRDSALSISTTMHRRGPHQRRRQHTHIHTLYLMYLPPCKVSTWTAMLQERFHQRRHSAQITYTVTHVCHGLCVQYRHVPLCKGSSVCIRRLRRHTYLCLQYRHGLRCRQRGTD